MKSSVLYPAGLRNWLTALLIFSMLKYNFHLKQLQWSWKHNTVTGYLKNHWTKHKLVWSHFEAYFMPSTIMYKIFSNSQICAIVMKNKRCYLQSTSHTKNGYLLHHSTVKLLESVANVRRKRYLHLKQLTQLSHSYLHHNSLTTQLLQLSKTQFHELYMFVHSSMNFDALNANEPHPLNLMQTTSLNRCKWTLSSGMMH